MVLSVTPSSRRMITAVSSERGIAVSEMNAVRASRRKSTSTTTTSAPPSPSAARTLSSEDSMKLAGPVQARVDRHALAREQRRELGERRLEGARHVHRVGAPLAREREQHAGPALHQRVAELGRGRLHHVGHVGEAQRRALPDGDHRLAERLRRRRLAVGGERDPLVRGLDEARAAHRDRLARRRHHVAEREAVRDQRLGMHLDLELAHVAAEDVHARDARHEQAAAAAASSRRARAAPSASASPRPARS